MEFLWQMIVFSQISQWQLFVAKPLLVALLRTKKLRKQQILSIQHSTLHLQNIDCTVSLVALVRARQRKPSETVKMVLLELSMC